MITGGRQAVDSRQQLELLLIALGQLVGNTEGLDFINKLLQVDEEGDTVYLGYADAGTATSDANWSIKKIVITNSNGCDADITWADGNKDFDNVWDNRTLLTYS